MLALVPIAAYVKSPDISLCVPFSPTCNLRFVIRKSFLMAELCHDFDCYFRLGTGFRLNKIVPSDEIKAAFCAMGVTR